MIRSLGARLLVAATFVLAAFFGVTGVVLDRAYYRSAEAALRERVENYAYTLIAAAQTDARGAVRMALPLPETRIFRPGSGLYARIVRNDGRYAWRSPSMQAVSLPFPAGLERSQRRFDTLTGPDGSRVFGFSIGVTWDEAAAGGRVYTVSVGEDMAEFAAQVAGYRRTLWSSLGVVGVLLLMMQWGILRWGLAPLRRAAADLVAIEHGTKTRLDEDYPSELRGLTANLNALVRNERERRERYRRVLGDLAHSLKTPLAVLRGAGEAGQTEAKLRAVVEEQVGRMSDIVEHQLQRAAATGRSVLHAGEPVDAVVRKVVDALDKAYADKGVRCRLDVDPGARFYGDQGDLMEILGNLMDNAYKWCRTEVVVEVRSGGAAPLRDRGLTILVQDDGPGVPPSIREQVFRRGAGTAHPRGGHGIGLAVVRDIVDVYHGKVAVGDSRLGGALVEVTL